MTHPEIMSKSKQRLFAYINSYPQNQVMGVTIDGTTGKTIQAVILPTKQRVMLGLGIGDDKANAHNTYRQLYPKGYVLRWSDDPDTDERLADLKGRLIIGARELRKHGVHVAEHEVDPHMAHNKEVAGSLKTTGQLTTELIRGGVEEAKAIPSPARREGAELPEQQDAGDTDAGSGDTPPAGNSDAADTHGGFF